MQGHLDQLSKQIRQKKSYLIGICGIPGSGKSHCAQLLHKRLQNSMIVPMDGFHLYRKDLTPQGIRFRGAAFTFDLVAFKNKIIELSQRKNLSINFPSFDHTAKYPRQDAITIGSEIEHIIVQGLYLFDKYLELSSWDCKIWVEADVDLAMDRVAARHFACGIQPTMEACIHRANDNDRKNSQYVLQNSNLENSHIITNNLPK